MQRGTEIPCHAPQKGEHDEKQKHSDRGPEPVVRGGELDLHGSSFLGQSLACATTAAMTRCRQRTIPRHVGDAIQHTYEEEANEHAYQGYR
jgi:hypothetical protein